jgi:hypothetical protein
MFEPYSGIDTTDGEKLMTAPQDSIAALLARQFLGVPVDDALDRVLELGMRRITEMTMIGFSTNSLFELSYLAQHMKVTRPFLLTSQETETTYLVCIKRQAGEIFYAAVQVYHEGQVHDKFFRMTLVRADNGSIHATPGW